MDGVIIEWVHPTESASLGAAEQMVSAFGMNHLHAAPALHSLHNERNSIDMNISWTGSVTVEDAGGNLPHNLGPAFEPQLKEVPNV
jgi:hypothetical protein